MNEPEKEKGFDEARYYYDEQVEMGGVDINGIMDDAIKEDILEALENENLTHIQIEVHHGVVSLKGMAQTETSMKRIEETLSNVPRIKRIENHLVIGN